VVVAWIQYPDYDVTRLTPAGELAGVPSIVAGAVHLRARFDPALGVRVAYADTGAPIARLELFDIAGRRLAAQSVAAGAGEVTMTGTRGLAPGVFLVRLSTTARTAVRSSSRSTRRPRGSCPGPAAPMLPPPNHGGDAMRSRIEWWWSPARAMASAAPSRWRSGAKARTWRSPGAPLRSSRQVAADLGPSAPLPLVLPTDLRDDGAIAHLIDTTHGHFGRLDVLVNNSGIAGPTALARDITTADWTRRCASISPAHSCVRATPRRT